jgi:16S rRNA (guanine966-N2)-methyltransferase
MRIIAGEAQGRRLAAPRAGTRPFTSRAKEGVFSSLQARVAGAAVLDLFAGSGSLGLEALSRGADSAVFVEQNRESAAVIAANIDAVGLGGTTVRRDVEAFLRSDGRIYDLVFVDPPYAFEDGGVEKVLGLIANRISGHGTVVLHRRFGGTTPESDNLQRTDRKRYGDSEIWIFEKEQS